MEIYDRYPNGDHIGRELVASFEAVGGGFLDIYYLEISNASTKIMSDEERYTEWGIGFFFTNPNEEKMVVEFSPKEDKIYEILKNMFLSIDGGYKTSEVLKKFEHVTKKPNEIFLFNDYLDKDILKQDGLKFVNDNDMIKLEYVGESNPEKVSVKILKNSALNGEYAYLAMKDAFSAIYHVNVEEETIGRHLN